MPPDPPCIANCSSCIATIRGNHSHSGSSLGEYGEGIAINLHSSPRHLHRLFKLGVIGREANSALWSERDIEVVAHAEIEPVHNVLGKNDACRVADLFQLDAPHRLSIRISNHLLFDGHGCSLSDTP